MAEPAGPDTAAELDAPPKAGQRVAHDGKLYTTVQEGRAFILIPPDAPLAVNPKAESAAASAAVQAQAQAQAPAPTAQEQRQSSSSSSALSSPAAQFQSVFYNPIQQYNRDLSVLAIRAFGADFVAATAAAARSAGRARAKRAKKLAARRQGAKDGDDNDNGGARGDGVSPGAKRRKLDSGGAAPGKAVAEEEDEKKEKERSLPGGQPANADDDDDDDDEFENGGISDEVLLVAEKSFDNSLLDTASQQNGTEKARTGEAKHNGPAGNSNESPKIVFSILDAFSGTGLRALRYATEIPFATSITANDLSPRAVESIKNNIKHNNLSNPGKIQVSTGNAIQHMSSTATGGGTGSKYTVIDIDPYGTAVPFLDSAVQAVVDGGLLCVTCTDSAVFNSIGYLEKTYSLYGGVPIKGMHCHEGGLRLVLHAIATAAGKYGISIEPLLSLSIDFYIRVFVRLRKAPAEVKFLGSKAMMLYSCDSGCGAWTTQSLVRSHKSEGKKGAFYKHSTAQAPTTTPLCEHCGFKLHLSGPMWGGPLHNPSFILRVLSVIETSDPAIYRTLDRAKGMLATALEETDLYSDIKAAPEDEDSAEVAESSNQSSEVGDTQETGRFVRMPIELLDPHPFYVFPTVLSRVLHVISPSDAQIIGALRGMGHRAVRSHCKPGSIKTDAPWTTIWEVMRAWVKQKAPIRDGALNSKMAGWRIMNGIPAAAEPPPKEEWDEVLRDDKELKVIFEDGVGWKVLRKKHKTDTEAVTGDVSANTKPNIVFDEVLGKRKRRGPRLVRYQENPRENWGPMRKAKGRSK